jgi:hypothetical protein
LFHGAHITLTSANNTHATHQNDADENNDPRTNASATSTNDGQHDGNDGKHGAKDVSDDARATAPASSTDNAPHAANDEEYEPNDGANQRWHGLEFWDVRQF